MALFISDVIFFPEIFERLGAHRQVPPFGFCWRLISPARSSTLISPNRRNQLRIEDNFKEAVPKVDISKLRGT
ncbi:hypothetical protein, partial [Paenibacillus spiritus]|uniref:hypothetical protein n=1 Tax=Paenibacillus spiritus TaxID=2496557 RepID=UPI001CC659B5